jgi:Bacterial Ig-like domain
VNPERERDAELDSLFEEDPDLRDVANLLRSVPHERPEPDPVFRANLRRRLIEEAWKMREPSLPWWRRLAAPPRLAWSGALVGILLIALAVTMLSTQHGGSQVIVVHSNLEGSKSVAVVSPIELQFSQPMDKQATNEAIKVQPSTRVSYEWPSTKVVDIVPAQGALAPATKYDVTVGASARTTTGQTMGSPRTFTFVTGPPPATPPPSVAPTPPPNNVGNPVLSTPRRLGPIGNAPAVWSADGSKIYVIDPSGQLIEYQAASGNPTTIAAGGVTLAAVGPGGVAYAQGGKIVYGGQSVTVAGSPLAIGFHGGKLMYVSGSSVTSADHSLQIQLDEQPSAAAFSPDGSRLAYIGSGGLHLVDLNSGKDQAPLSGVSALGAFSSDGAHYAYPTDASVGLTDGGTSQTGHVSGAGVTGLSWSKDDQLLLAEPNGLFMEPAGGGTQAPLAGLVVSQPQWSPAAGRTLSYARSGWIYVAQVISSGQAQQSSSQQDVANSFMTARQKGEQATASSLLDDSGQAAFSSQTLVYRGGQTLSRWQVLLDQPGHMVVRLVIDQASGSAETAVDEDLTFARDAQGRILIHGASDGSPRVLGKGPEVVGVQVSGSQVTVTFDSDIDAKTISAVSVQERGSASTSYDAGKRAVTLTFSRPLGATTYHLLISGALRDYQGRSVTPFSLAFNGPSTGDSPGTTTDPSPTPARPETSPTP